MLDVLDRSLSDEGVTDRDRDLDDVPEGVRDRLLLGVLESDLDEDRDSEPVDDRVRDLEREDRDEADDDEEDLLRDEYDDVERLLGDRRFGDVVRCHGSCHSSLANLSLDIPRYAPFPLDLSPSTVSLSIGALVLVVGLTSLLSISLLLVTDVVLSFSSFFAWSLVVGFEGLSLSLFLLISFDVSMLPCLGGSLLSRPRRSYLLLRNNICISISLSSS